MPTNTRQAQWHSRRCSYAEQVIGPYAPSWHDVLDTPRTRLQLAAEANRLRAEAHAATEHLRLPQGAENEDEEGAVAARGGAAGRREWNGAGFTRSALSRPGRCQPDPQWEPKYEGEPQRFLEYYYNVENQRTRWEYPLSVDTNGVPRDDLQGAVWERKLTLLQQLTPRPVDPAALARKLVDGKLKEPTKWKWRETDNERRRRLRFIKERDARVKEDEKRRRENPTDAEVIEDTVEYLCARLRNGRSESSGRSSLRAQAPAPALAPVVRRFKLSRYLWAAKESREYKMVIPR